jgi:hypothetical protein
VWPLLSLLGLLGVAALLRLASWGTDQIVTLPGSLAALIGIPIYARRRAVTIGKAPKILMLLVQGALWGPLVYASMESGVITAGIHQPGGALLMFVGPLGFLVGILVVAVAEPLEPE